MKDKLRLDQLVFKRELAESRAQAAALIMTGKVLVDGIMKDKPGQQVNSRAHITLIPGSRYVSRAGLKLESADAKFKLDFKDKIVLDVGSSTGGFSDYALQQGAATIYAVDVGTHQLHERIRSDSRVLVMEQTDIRQVSLSPADSTAKSAKQTTNEYQYLPKSPDIIMIDVSFISLRQILPHVAQLISNDGLIVAMCKPQFEAGVKEASKHKGVIKNDTIRRKILKEFELWAKSQFIVLAKADSRIPGAKGNVERFYLLQPMN